MYTGKEQKCFSHTHTLLPVLAVSRRSSPPEALSGCYPALAPLATCHLLAINAHFTHSSTPLALICVALDIVHAGRYSTLLFHPVWSTDGLHGPRREDFVFQVFSTGSRGGYWAAQGHWQYLARRDK